MEGGDIRCWDRLIPDALVLIFCKLSLEDKLFVIPRICKSWRKAVMEPYCWQEIEINEYSPWQVLELVGKGIIVNKEGGWKWVFTKRESGCRGDRMLQMLIPRSSGSLRKLSVSVSNDAMFSFIADHAGSLQILQMPHSRITDSIVEKVAGRMRAITFLDLSYCVTIGVLALEAFGSNCRLLMSLKRNMCSQAYGWADDDYNEPHAIATTMPELKHLELTHMPITTQGVLDILSGCPKLVFFDVRGNWGVELDEKYLNERFPGVEVHMHCDEVHDFFTKNNYCIDDSD